MTSRILRRLPVLLILLLTAAAVPAGENSVSGEFWVRRDMMDIHSPGTNYRETGEFSERENEEIRILLEDARWAFSGMIYGFSFTWTPSSIAREVEEELAIEPLGLIPWGDPRMSTLAVVEEDGFIWIQVAYDPDEVQQSRLRSWTSGAHPVASGMGEVRAMTFNRRDAMEQAVKEAVRAWLRAREFNRPREVTGKVAFAEFPVTGLKADAITASVTLRLVLEPLRHYAID